ncbi:MAG: glycosyltransferase family 39 protein, partial [Chloroflexota bacterium]
MTFVKTHALKIILLIAVILRLCMLFVFSDIFNFVESEAIHGSDAYDVYATNLLETGVYGRTSGVPDALIPPMYSYVLAGVYAIFGRGFLQVGLFHILLDIGTMLLLYEIARRLFSGANIQEDADGTFLGIETNRWVGLLAVLMMACYPYLIFQNLTLIDTPFWMLMLHLFVWLMILLRDEPTGQRVWWLAIATGLALGIATMARSITPPLALLGALWFTFRLSWWESFKRLLPVAIISVLCVVPWIARNYIVFDTFIPMSTTSGSNLYQGNNEFVVPLMEAGYDVQWTAPDPALLEGAETQREQDAIRTELVVQYWQDNPDELLPLFWTKFLVQWSVEITPRLNPQFGETFALDDDGQLIVNRGDESIEGVNEANVAYNGGLIDTVGRPVHIFYFGSLLFLALMGFLLSLRYWRE